MATTLEILAPYLPSKIEIEGKAKNHPRERGILEGFWYSRTSKEILADVLTPNRTESWGYGLEDITPVLRPFWQLCDRLFNGDIPAVEALRIALGWPVTFYKDRFTARLSNNIPGEWCVRVENHSDHSGGWIRLGGDYGAWLFEAFDSYEDGVGKPVKVVNPLAAYDYLRSQSFAVGLEPHQFIEKAPTPTTQEGASHE